MVFSKLGGIYYTETYEINKIDYGGNIPCFIGRTINPNKTQEWTKQASDELYRTIAIEELASAETSYTESAVTDPTEEQITAQINLIKTSASGHTKPTDAQINTRAGELKTAELGKHKINQLQQFYNFTQVNSSSLTDGKLDGLGNWETEKEQNPLLNFIHDFCEETKMMTEEYVACPYFYVIDLGMADTLDQWINSIETSKLKKEIDFEVYVGFDDVLDTKMTESSGDDVTATLEDFALAVNYELYINRQVIGDFRKAFYTKLHRYTQAEVTANSSLTLGDYADNTWYKNNYKTTDAELITIAKNMTGANSTYDDYFTKNADDSAYTGTITKLTTNTISKSRTYLTEPLFAGKIVGRITVTPYDMEPGYYAYNTLTVDDIILRKPSERLQMQMGGVIFNQLEETSSEEYCKINRTQAVSSNLQNHPPDALFQARNLCDELLTRLFDVCYPQIKNKETETNLAYLQTNVSKVVNDAIEDGDFIPPYTVNNERKGTFMNVQESSEDAYDIELVGMLQPVNCTYSIHIVAKINDVRIQVMQS